MGQSNLDFPHKVNQVMSLNYGSTLISIITFVFELTYLIVIYYYYFFDNLQASWYKIDD